MHIGYSSMNTHTQIQPAELAVAVEERGFESLWYGEHSQIPIARESPHPRDDELLDAYKNMMDPYVSLAVAGTVTQTLKLGTSVSLILERELFSQSKTIMTIDRLTEGRLAVGVGVGWNREQFENASSMPWKRRFTAIRETVEALRTLWTEDEPEYHGELVEFDAVWCNPKPIQKGGPPLLFGAMGPVGLRHVAQWADGWMPLDLHLEDVGAAVKAMRNDVAEAGRDADAFDVTLVVMRKPDLGQLKRYQDMGIDRCLVGSSIEHADQPDRMWRDLDALAELVSAM